MRDSRHGVQGDGSGDGLSGLARNIVARLVTRDGFPVWPDQRKVDDEIVAALARAVISADPAPLQSLKADLRRARISETDLVDSYFPAVARYLGCAWAEDRSPFTDVTIGVARMQAILRQVGRDWTSNAAARPDSATVLMVLPQGEQHSFGMFVLAGQLRRHGVSVRLEIGASAATLAELVRRRTFDCAMISVGCEEKLDECRKLVNAIRGASGGGLRVAVGGAVLERSVDVQARSGADCVTNDPMLALADVSRRAALPEGESVWA
jgi:MerR family transcriptional regulator, light-induced transcriptional regulator